MRLTPLEIRKQTFTRKRFGGADPDEVQDFLNLVAAELESVLREHALSTERLAGANQKIHEFRSMEETLRKTLVKAEQLKSESEDNARREGELVIEQARLRAERVLADARTRLRQLTDEIDELKKKKEVFLHRFRSLVEMQMDLLEQHRHDFDEISEIAREAHHAVDAHGQPVAPRLGASPVDGPRPTNGGAGPPDPLELGADDDAAR